MTVVSCPLIVVSLGDKLIGQSMSNYFRKQSTYLIVLGDSDLMCCVKLPELVMSWDDLPSPGCFLLLFLGLHDAYYRDKLGTDPLQKQWHLADIK